MAPITSRSTPTSGAAPTRRPLSMPSPKRSLSFGDASIPCRPVTMPARGSTAWPARRLRISADRNNARGLCTTNSPNKDPIPRPIRPRSSFATLRRGTYSMPWIASVTTIEKCSGLPHGRISPTPRSLRSSVARHMQSTSAWAEQRSAWSASSNEPGASGDGPHGWTRARREVRHEPRR
jgi:hypothetical protein